MWGLMPVTLIQAVDGAMVNSGTVSTSFTSSVTTGNLLIVHWASLSASRPQVPILSDTLTSSWIPLFNLQDSEVPSSVAWYCFANASGPETVNISSGVAFNGIELAEFAGVNAIDQITIPVGWQGTVSGQTMLSNPITTLNNNEVLISFGVQAGGGFGAGGVQSPMLPLSQLTAVGATFGVMGYKIVSSIQTGFQAQIELGNASDNGSIQLTSFSHISPLAPKYVVISTFFQ